MAPFLAGIDIGSTTVKLAVLEAGTNKVVHRAYRRHRARQISEAKALLKEFTDAYPGHPLRLAIAGSGGADLAKALGVPFIQEVVANATALQKLYPETRTAIELGGQDAKVIFFTLDGETGNLEVDDMRMNGACAGGTGAFIDEIAALLHVPTEQFDQLATRGETVYPVSGRCGVFAKTDMQPLINQGIAKADLALSAFHAIAKQTIGGLAQGCTIEAPVAFEGGPLLFNPTLVKVFVERLGLEKDQIIVPEHSEAMVALGAALSLESLPDQGSIIAEEALATMEELAHTVRDNTSANPLFANADERARFYQRHGETPPPPGPRAETVTAYLGIDSGSTTTKVALVDLQGELIDAAYAPNEGEPLRVARRMLIDLRDRWRAAGGALKIAALGVTGYGEHLFSEAYQADCHMVETVAHARAALASHPEATFVLDIGGQDMKALWLDEGIITDIVVNEACSSGCGSFLEGFASSLSIAREDMADAAFASTSPAELGSRCTVFMESSVITAQRNGKQPEDIMAGLSRSIAENVLTKVIRSSNLDAMGEHVVVQGGTFANDAVLRAFEERFGREVTRTKHPELAGAIGAALVAADRIEHERAGQLPRFIGFDAVEALSFSREQNVVCTLCGNHCARTVIRFSSGASYVTGNRCARGETIVSTPEDRAAKEHTKDRAPENRMEERAEDRAPEGLAKDSQAESPATATTTTTTEAHTANASSASVTTTGASAANTAPSPASDLLKKPHAKRPARLSAGVPNLFNERERLVFKDYPTTPVLPPNGITIGLPRVLSLWDEAPFWKTFFQSLGFTVRLSRPSTRKRYENSLASIASDTACLPAKLSHSHVRDLADQGVDRIFMPIITAMKPEGSAAHSESVCALVKGYPMVIRSSDEPETAWGVPFDTPLFHWHSSEDRQRQLCRYMAKTFCIRFHDTQAAIEAGDQAKAAFQAALQARGHEVIEQTRAEGKFAVVVASRPYQNDPLINHGLPDLITAQGIPVLTVDSLPELDQIDLDASRLDIVNNYHARMLRGALYVAGSDCLEYLQLVSFGCGHDAYLSDEIIRLMKGASAKTPLVVKLDEGDVRGPLEIRVRSFLETVTARRGRVETLRCKNTPRLAAQEGQSAPASPAASSAALPPTTPAVSSAVSPAAPSVSDPYPAKFNTSDRATKTVLVPNTSHAFGRLMSAVFAKQGLRTVALPLGRERASALGKRYVHNDICYPAQMVIGEVLEALESGQYDPNATAVGMAKYLGDCRLTHYSALLRKALDDAGYAQVPIITNDADDESNMHPGFKMSIASALRVAFCLPMIDALEELLRKMRPYELEAGRADAAFEEALDAVIEGVGTRGIAGAKKGFKQAIQIMEEVPYDRSEERPSVLIVGEYLLNFHPGANRDIERYLEDHGMEVIEARMTDVIRKTYFYQRAQVREFDVQKPFAERTYLEIVNKAFEKAHDMTDQIAKEHPLYEPPCRMPELVEASDPIVHHTFDAGEGVLIPAEILHQYEHGVRAFVILQPFGCLPNHIVGRGIVKSLRKECPEAQILTLDYDPDVSTANIENRLQMLTMRAKDSRSKN